MINLVLIALGHYSIDFLPWLLRPGPGEPYHKMLIIPWGFQILFFSTFLVAAWLGYIIKAALNSSASPLKTPASSPIAIAATIRNLRAGIVYR